MIQTECIAGSIVYDSVVARQLRLAMSLLSEYFGIYTEYRDKYGEKIVVLMQVGSFYEVYGIESKLGNAEEVSGLLNVVLTRKNKKLPHNGMQNPLMLGFPCLALSKYVPVLLNDDYTIVVVDQVKVGIGFRRKVTDVISPSTYIDSNHDDNYLVLIHVDKHGHIGMSAISVLTGSSAVHELYSDPNDKNAPLDEALGFIKQYRPREVVLSGSTDRGIISYLELENSMCHLANSSPRNIAYQNAVLGCAFENNTMLSNIEYLDLERMPYALISYVELIEFVHGHNPMLLRRMSKPDMYVNNLRLVLSTSTLDQLDVTGKSKYTLFNVVNKCSTYAGRRLLLRRLTAPVADAQELRKRYDQIDEFGALFGHDVISIEKILKKVADIERLHRRMTVGVTTPAELANLVESYGRIVELDDLLKKRDTRHIYRISNEYREALIEFVDTCNYVFDMNTMHMRDAETVVFNDGVFSDIDKLRFKAKLEMDVVNKLAEKISNYGVDGVRVEYAQNFGYYVTVSSARAKKIPKSRDIIIKSNKTVARVTSPDVDEANKRLQHLETAIRSKTKSRYKRALEYLSSHSSKFEKHVTSFLSALDAAKSNYVTSSLYNYCRPDVTTDVPGFVDAKSLRHAIIERIDDGNEYVPNDVALGRDKSGIILYSMNSCGKTSLLRALGLSVILAQAGCFVPASSFSISPFRCIMTRILSRDNIMKGQSSFVAEMSELKAILSRAVDESTLVLADEITHGTEHTSGSAIFVSSVETLASRNVNFMFTTHLHNVYPLVRDIHNVQTCHLSVSFGNDKILFERKLRDGPGGSIYGLEVCEYLNMDREFLSRAFHIRNMITPDKTEKYNLHIRLSRYNKNKVKISCESCGYSPRLPTDAPLHTHHVKEQRHADQNGMINGLHKDALSNLMVLCNTCHDKKHAQ